MSTVATTDARKPLKGTMVGRVLSDKREKTRKVVVEYQTRLRKYGKFVRRRTVLHIDDPTNDARLGDTVEIARCRPISKTKSWRLLRVLERAPEQVALKEEVTSVVVPSKVTGRAASAGSLRQSSGRGGDA